MVGTESNADMAASKRPAIVTDNPRALDTSPAIMASS
jgi:hypothetical protein